ncbi:MAG TPA: peptidase [Candidatus Kryptonia bacterium]|nr:peptidase [Candidatus Kryptonia bacterium]
MTFCLGIKVDDGLVGIADTLITAGSETSTAAKIFTYEHERQSLFIMTSGLRSVRDKALTYFEEVLDEHGPTFDRVFKALNAFGTQVRRVAEEDKEALVDGGLVFNIHALVGGQFERDREHKLYLMYPQANWVEVGQGTPSQIIGAAGYGKPVLDRTLKYRDPMSFALKVGCLAFDSTRISAADVDFPIDVVLYERGSYELVEQRYEKQDLAEISNWWQERLRKSVNELQSDWAEPLLSRLPSRRTVAPGG